MFYNNSLRRKNQNHHSPISHQNKPKKYNYIINNNNNSNGKNNGEMKNTIINDKGNIMINVEENQINLDLIIEENNSSMCNKGFERKENYKIRNYDNMMNKDNNGFQREDYENRLEVVLTKDHKYKDFGFYIAQSQKHGLYISKVRENSSNIISDQIKPFRKILKVIFWRSFHYFSLINNLLFLN